MSENSPPTDGWSAVTLRPSLRSSSYALDTDSERTRDRCRFLDAVSTPPNSAPLPRDRGGGCWVPFSCDPAVDCCCPPISCPVAVDCCAPSSCPLAVDCCAMAGAPTQISNATAAATETRDTGSGVWLRNNDCIARLEFDILRCLFGIPCRFFVIELDIHRFPVLRSQHPDLFCLGKVQQATGCRNELEDVHRGGERVL